MNFEVDAICISSAAADHHSKFLVRYSLFVFFFLPASLPEMRRAGSFFPKQRLGKNVVAY
ncbi:MAG: hypothetical protein Q8N83_14860 [Ignavibacteria bacterium]|nr:hypothetical protein [Ignavibacteria bacterium]